MWAFISNWRQKKIRCYFWSVQKPFSPPLFFLLFFIFSFPLSEVEDVNDNAPLTSDPIYHPVVMENSPKDVSIIHIQAQDPDLTSTPSRLSYRITAGNPQNFFAINPRTGETRSSKAPVADDLHLPAAGGKVFFATAMRKLANLQIWF